MSADTLVAVVGTTLALVLAIRGVRGRNLRRGKFVTMAVIWAAIIGVLTLAMSRMSP